MNQRGKRVLHAGSGVGTHTNEEMAIHLLFILTTKDKGVIMIIMIKKIRSTFSFIFSDPEVLFPLCFEC